MITEEVENEPLFEPECTEDPDVIEEMNVDCEFENRNGQWWCITHNCSA